MANLIGQLPAALRPQILDLIRQISGVSGRVDEIVSGSSTVDHGALIGLADDDHTQYALSNGTRGNFEPTGAAIAQRNAHEAASNPHPQYVQLAGGTMTGALSGVTPTSAGHLTRKDYVDAATGALSMSLGEVIADLLDVSEGLQDEIEARIERDGELQEAIGAEALARENADSALEGAKVDRAGDTLTGHLSGIAPSAGAHLTRKDYVDGHVSALSDRLDDEAQARIDADLDLAGFIDDVQEALDDHEAAVDPHPQYMTEAESDARYVNVSGDTMTGALVGITPTADGHLTRKDYVDAADGLRVLKAGDTLTGHLSGIAPSGAAHLTRKDYVDAGLAAKLNLSGGTLSGAVSGVTPTDAAHLTRKDYVDSGDSANASALSAHINDSSAAHDASAIFYDDSLIAPPTNAWFAADDVQEAITKVAAEVDGRIEAGDTAAIIDAINNWQSGDPQFTESDVFSAGLIVADAIASGAVVASKIAANAVEASHIGASQVQTSHLQAGAVVAGKIEAGAVEATHLSAGSVSATAIQANAVQTGHLAAGSVKTAQIDAGAIDASKVQAGSITAAQIAAGTITANELATDAVTSTNYEPYRAADMENGLVDYNSGTHEFTTAEPIFSASDVGRYVAARGGDGPGFQAWAVEIVGFNSATSVELASPSPLDDMGVWPQLWYVWVTDAPHPPAPQWSMNGTSLDLADGSISSIGLSLDGPTGTLRARGELSATSFSILGNTDTPVLRYEEGDLSGFGRLEMGNPWNDGSTRLEWHPFGLGLYRDDGLGGESLIEIDGPNGARFSAAGSEIVFDGDVGYAFTKIKAGAAYIDVNAGDAGAIHMGIASADAAPMSAAHLTRKDYVDTKLALTGGTLSGALAGTTATFSGDVSADRLAINDSDDSHRLWLTTASNLTADRTLAIDTGDANRTLTLYANAALDQDVSSYGAPHFAGGVTVTSSPSSDAHLTRKDYVDGLVDDRAPLGVALEYYGAVAPTGYAFCEGQSLARATYPLLADVLAPNSGSPFWVDATYFTVPDKRSRVAVGRAASGFAATLGATGGSASAVVVSHTHPMPHTHTTPNHTHPDYTTPSTGTHNHGQAQFLMNAALSGGSQGLQTNAGPAVLTWREWNPAAAPDQDGRHQHVVQTPSGGAGTTGPVSTANTSTAGVSGTNANLQPYIVCNYIMRLA